MSYSEPFAEDSSHCILWKPRHLRAYICHSGWWHGGCLLWRQQEDIRTKTGLGEKSVWWQPWLVGGVYLRVFWVSAKHVQNLDF